MTRFALYAVALLTGLYSALMWSLAELRPSGIAGSICAVALIAAEAIRYCAPARNRGNTPIHPRWHIEDQSRWTLPDYHFDSIVLPDRLPVWPNEIGAPE